jgi:hypothetical protein
VDENEPDDVVQGQTRMECLWNKRPLERTVLKGVAKGWYANHLIWPKPLDQSVDQGDLIGQVPVVSDLSLKPG